MRGPERAIDVGAKMLEFGSQAAVKYVEAAHLVEFCAGKRHGLMVTLAEGGRSKAIDSVEVEIFVSKFGM
jgi:hypothetical protein